MNQNRKPKVNQARLTLILIVIIGFFLATMIYILNQVKKDQHTTKQPTVQIDQSEEEPEDTQKEGSICVIKEVNLGDRTIVLYDTVKDCTVKLSYTGGTDIRDKYSQVIAASQLVVGDMAEAVYQESDQSLQSLMNSPNTWEYTNVTGLSPDRTNKIIKLYGEKYRYTSKLYVRNEDGECGLLSLNAEDTLIVRGYEKNIYSITVTRGHGSIVLENSDYLQGGTITIDGKEYSEFSDDMVFTAREGKVTIEMEKDDLDERITVEVIRDQEVKVDLGMYAPEPEEKGKVTFVIRPFGAELFIDDAMMSYADPIELTYGEHTIEVSLNGYETYTGTYDLSVPTDIVQIELPETVVKEESTEGNNNETGNSNQTTNPSTPTENNSTQNNNATQNNSSTGSNTGSNSSNNSNNTANNSTSSNSSENSTDKEEDSKEVDPEHTITIQSPTGVSVYINGVYRGIAPITTEKPLGLTYITLLREGYEQITHTVNIEDDDENKQYQFPKLVLSEE